MEEYSIQIWLLLFFVYSFLGWIWETSYVSIKEHKFQNRGFVRGPFLPIYGSGALIILLSTVAVRENIYLIFILGSLSSTILEVITGYVMELIFKVRYWDYSYKKIHYKGYICLSSTIAWGFFSIILVMIINVPIENLVFQIPSVILEVIVLLLVIVFTVDYTKSIQNALELKKLLESIAANNKEINAIVTKIENISARISESKDGIKQDLESVLKEVTKDLKELKKNTDNISSGIRLKLTSIAEKVSHQIKNLKEKNTTYDANAVKNLTKELSSVDEKVRNRNANEYKGAKGVLKRNPTASSRKLKEEIKEAKKL